MRYLILFLLTISCSKSSLEDCADKTAKGFTEFNKLKITEPVKLTPREKQEVEKNYQLKVSELKNKHSDRLDCTKNTNRTIFLNENASEAIIPGHQRLSKNEINRLKKVCKSKKEYDLALYFLEKNRFIDTKEKFVRFVSPEENKQKYISFIKKELKTKINESKKYEAAYQKCIDFKESNPEMFKAKHG